MDPLGAVSHRLVTHILCNIHCLSCFLHNVSLKNNVLSLQHAESGQMLIGWICSVGQVFVLILLTCQFSYVHNYKELYAVTKKVVYMKTKSRLYRKLRMRKNQELRSSSDSYCCNHKPYPLKQMTTVFLWISLRGHKLFSILSWTMFSFITDWVFMFFVLVVPYAVFGGGTYKLLITGHGKLVNWFGLGYELLESPREWGLEPPDFISHWVSYY